MATVLITGGTGMIGKALTNALLEKNYNVIVLSRTVHDDDSPGPALSYAQWDVAKQTINREAVAKADYIVHLAGAGVADKRWTKKRKQEIVDSRVKSGELLVKVLKETPNKVKAVLSSSGIGWYGPDPVVPNKNPFTEADPVQDDFLGQTCMKWEECLEAVTGTGRRLIKFRTGIVLSAGGGAMNEFLKPLTYGIATILGGGRQIISWIHIDDLTRLYISAIENENMNGVYNAVSPFPVSNKDLILKLATRKRGSFFIPLYVPAFALKLVLGEMSIEVLKSCTVSSLRLYEAGFTFAYPDIEKAVKDLVK